MSQEKKQQEHTEQSSQEATCEQALAKMTTERDDWKDKCLRIAADFENFKKRTLKDREQWQQLIRGKMLVDFLSVVDDIERAVASQDEPNEALSVIHKQFVLLLQSYNVSPIESIEMFDPVLHEAVTHVPSREHESGAIIEVLQKGYMIGDAVLRPAKVAVAQ